jgi:hypothetical protein
VNLEVTVKALDEVRAERDAALAAQKRAEDQSLFLHEKYINEEAKKNDQIDRTEKAKRERDAAICRAEKLELNQANAEYWGQMWAAEQDRSERALEARRRADAALSAALAEARTLVHEDNAYYSKNLRLEDKIGRLRDKIAAALAAQKQAEDRFRRWMGALVETAWAHDVALYEEQPGAFVAKLEERFAAALAAQKKAEAECKRLMETLLRKTSGCEKCSNEREWAEEARR